MYKIFVNKEMLEDKIRGHSGTEVLTFLREFEGYGGFSQRTYYRSIKSGFNPLHLWALCYILNISYIEIGGVKRKVNHGYKRTGSQ